MSDQTDRGVAPMARSISEASRTLIGLTSMPWTPRFGTDLRWRRSSPNWSRQKRADQAQAPELLRQIEAVGPLLGWGNFSSDKRNQGAGLALMLLGWLIAVGALALRKDSRACGGGTP